MRSIWGLAFAALAATGAGAEERVVGLRDVTAVADGADVARIYFCLGDLGVSANAIVESAVLVIPFSGSEADRGLEIRVCPVTAAWSDAAPTLATEFDADLYGRCEVDLRTGSGTALVDVTVPLKEILEEGLTADGFVLLSPPGRETRGDLARFAALSGAELRIQTTVLPSGRPPTRWLERDGMN